MTEKTYVYNDTEVNLTGRTAEREMKPAATATSRLRKVASSSVALVEITPVDPETGSWKKWVRMVDLYEIKAK